MSEMDAVRIAAQRAQVTGQLDVWFENLWEDPRVWGGYLHAQAETHALDPETSILVELQRDGRIGEAVAGQPPVLASVPEWNAVGRSVEKGQKGYAVLGPAPEGTQEAVAVFADGETRPWKGAEDELGAGERFEQRNVDRIVKYVFDVRQTKGRELPAVGLQGAPAPDAADQLRDYLRGLMAAKESKAQVRTSAFVDLSNEETPVRTLETTDAVRVLAEDLAHRVLHGPPPGRYFSRDRKDVEAAGVAIVVAAAHGLPTADTDTTAKYKQQLSAWLADASSTEILATQRRIQETAHKLIDSSPVAHYSGGNLREIRAAIRADRANELVHDAQREMSHRSVEGGLSL